MNERIDIKLFKAQSKLKVTMGKLLKLDNFIEGKEIEFYNIATKDIINLSDFKDTIDMYYTLIPLLTNVDTNTISKEELADMEGNRTLVFDNFLNAFTENLKDIMISKQNNIQVSKDINKFMADNGIDVEALNVLQVKKTKENIEKEIQECYEVMKTDKEHRKEILEKIDVLEKELSELDE